MRSAATHVGDQVTTNFALNNVASVTCEKSVFQVGVRAMIALAKTLY